jgi:spermidine synthase
MLVLDGVIQLTERDEFSYQEMLAHSALFSHPEPRRVLIIGGGDGGILREVCRHSVVREIVQVEIDAGVIQASKQFFKDSMGCSFDDPRLNLIVGDGAAYVKGCADAFDAILVDSSDPIGPAAVLFEGPFYQACHNALKPGGVMCNQGECMWLHLDLIGESLQMCHTMFSEASYLYTSVPTYPSGQIGFLLCRKKGGSSSSMLSEPLRQPAEEMQAQLRYYSPSTHRAAFVLPEFARRRLMDGTAN